MAGKKNEGADDLKFSSMDGKGNDVISDQLKFIKIPDGGEPGTVGPAGKVIPKVEINPSDSEGADGILDPILNSIDEAVQKVLPEGSDGGGGTPGVEEDIIRPAEFLDDDDVVGQKYSPEVDGYKVEDVEGYKVEDVEGYKVEDVEGYKVEDAEALIGTNGIVGEGADGIVGPAMDDGDPQELLLPAVQAAREAGLVSEGVDADLGDDGGGGPRKIDGLEGAEGTNSEEYKVTYTEFKGDDDPVISDPGVGVEGGAEPPATLPIPIPSPGSGELPAVQVEAEGLDEGPGRPHSGTRRRR